MNNIINITSNLLPLILGISIVAGILFNYIWSNALSALLEYIRYTYPDLWKRLGYLNVNLGWQVWGSFWVTPPYDTGIKPLKFFLSSGYKEVGDQKIDQLVRRVNFWNVISNANIIFLLVSLALLLFIEFTN